jgi:hypothetical protein
MTHLRRCDIASIKCRTSIFHVDNISQQRLYTQPFSTPMRCDNRHTVELRKDPVLGGRRERLQRWARAARRCTPVSARVSPEISAAGAERAYCSDPFRRFDWRRRTNADIKNPVTPAKEAVSKSCGQPNSSSPRKRGPRSKRLKSLGSRFRGNDGHEGESAKFRDWNTPSKAGTHFCHGHRPSPVWRDF